LKEVNAKLQEYSDLLKLPEDEQVKALKVDLSNKDVKAMQKGAGMCANCGKKETKEHELLACGECHGAYYCNKKCQKKDLANHQKVCQRMFVLPMY
jgi:hypothetical protein